MKKRWKDTTDVDLTAQEWEVGGNDSGFCDGNVEPSGSYIK
jgi:hypothetical protein